MTILGPYAALDHTFVIDVTNGDDEELAGLLAPLATESSDAVVIRIALPVDDEKGWIEVGDDRVEKSEASAIHERVLIEVSKAALEDLREPVLHGCLVRHRGEGVLVAGLSGSGKSTFVARLLQAGAAIVTEDLTALRADGTVRAFPRPVALGTSSLELLGIPIPEDDCGCGCIKHPLRAEFLGGGVAASSGIDVVVVINREGTGIADVTLPELLARLFHEASVGNVADLSHLELVGSVLAGTRCVELGTADLDGALADLDRFLAAMTAPERLPVTVERVGGLDALYLDGEVLLHDGGKVHHLDPVATAVWVLSTDGLSVNEVAAELECPTQLVVDTVQRLLDLELVTAST